jgi:signal transduction histidine kinase
MSAGVDDLAMHGRGDVLGELLHSISQPLTGLRCVLELELAVDEASEEHRDGILLALQQADHVIGLMQLMREYVEAERAEAAGVWIEMYPAVKDVVNELRSIAEVRGVALQFEGNCYAELPISENRLRMALQYLITAAIETQRAGSAVTISLNENKAGSVLRVEGERVARNWRLLRGRGRASAMSAEDEQVPLLRRTRLAVAARVFASAGCLPIFSEMKLAGFVLPTISEASVKSLVF